MELDYLKIIFIIVIICIVIEYLYPFLKKTYDTQFSIKEGATGCDETLKGDNGTGYRGCQTKTAGKHMGDAGLECINWLESAMDVKAKDGENGLGDHNYCRNPDNYGNGIWCYTKNGGWGDCEPLPPPALCNSIDDPDSFCVAGNGLIEAASTTECAGESCVKATDAGTCCKPNAKCDSIGDATAIAAFCDAGNGLIEAASTTDCAGESCVKATDEETCCAPAAAGGDATKNSVSAAAPDPTNSTSSSNTTQYQNICNQIAESSGRPTDFSDTIKALLGLAPKKGCVPPPNDMTTIGFDKCEKFYPGTTKCTGADCPTEFYWCPYQCNEASSEWQQASVEEKCSTSDSSKSCSHGYTHECRTSDGSTCQDWMLAITDKYKQQTAAKCAVVVPDSNKDSCCCGNCGGSADKAVVTPEQIKATEKVKTKLTDAQINVNIATKVNEMFAQSGDKNQGKGINAFTNSSSEDIIYIWSDTTLGDKTITDICYDQSNMNYNENSQKCLNNNNKFRIFLTSGQAPDHKTSTEKIVKDAQKDVDAATKASGSQWWEDQDSVVNTITKIMKGLSGSDNGVSSVSGSGGKSQLEQLQSAAGDYQLGAKDIKTADGTIVRQKCSVSTTASENNTTQSDRPKRVLTVRYQTTNKPQQMFDPQQLASQITQQRNVDMSGKTNNLMWNGMNSTWHTNSGSAGTNSGSADTNYSANDMQYNMPYNSNAAPNDIIGHDSNVNSMNSIYTYPG